MRTVRSLEEINRILLDDLEQATRRFRTATEAFRRVMDDVPSGVPAEDGLFRIERVATAKRTAIAELRRAINRHSDFIFKQKIPEDLLDE